MFDLLSTWWQADADIMYAVVRVDLWLCEYGLRVAGEGLKLLAKAHL